MIRLLAFAVALGLASSADAQSVHPADSQVETTQIVTGAPGLERVAAANEPAMLRHDAPCCACCDHDGEAGAMCTVHGEGAGGHGTGHDAMGGHECCCKNHGEGHGDSTVKDCRCEHHGEGHGAGHHGTHAAPAPSAAAHQHAAPAPPSAAHQHAENGEAHLNAAAVGHLHAAMGAYFAIGDALANDSMEGVNSNARDFGAAMHELTNTDVHGDEHFWHSRMVALQTINQRASNIAASSDLQDVRLDYGYLSDALQGIVGATGLHGMENVYVMICGMYRDAPQNGVWLQEGSTVRNPYFGSSMLRCARSQEAL